MMIRNCKSKENPVIASSDFEMVSKIVHFEQQVTIPATIGGTKCTIETDVVESKLPLLLSKNSLKKAQTVLNSDTAKMFGQPVQLFQTSSGNYRIYPCISRPPIFDGKKSNFLFFVQCYWDTYLVFFDFWKCGYTKKSGPQALNNFVVQLLLYMRAGHFVLEFRKSSKKSNM